MNVPENLFPENTDKANFAECTENALQDIYHRSSLCSLNLTTHTSGGHRRKIRLRNPDGTLYRISLVKAIKLGLVVP